MNKMIIEYASIYEDEIKKLLVELQEYLAKIDKERYSIVGKNYADEYFEKTIDDINKYKGKMYLYQENNEICGLVVGLINNDEIDTYDSKIPKRGRITELIVSSKYRKKGYGQTLLERMEQYLKSQGCEDILIGVYEYNENAIKFYEKNGYHTILKEMTKK